MKKIIFVVAMLVSALAVNAQDLFIKPMAGVNLANLTEDDCDMKTGFVIGLEVEKLVSQNVGLSAGLLYSVQGAKGSENGISAEIDLRYINIPILANIYIAQGFALKAGLQPGINLESKAKAKANGISASADLEGVKSLDLSIPIGLSYEVSNVVFDARYNWGLSKVMDVSNAKNSVFMLTIGYKFTLN